jgi:hypothetical protein
MSSVHRDAGRLLPKTYREKLVRHLHRRDQDTEHASRYVRSARLLPYIEVSIVVVECLRLVSYHYVYAVVSRVGAGAFYVVLRLTFTQGLFRIILCHD